MPSTALLPIANNVLIIFLWLALFSVGMGDIGAAPVAVLGLSITVLLTTSAIMRDYF